MTQFEQHVRSIMTDPTVLLVDRAVASARNEAAVADLGSDRDEQSANQQLTACLHEGCGDYAHTVSCTKIVHLQLQPTFDDNLVRIVKRVYPFLSERIEVRRRVEERRRLP